MIQDDLEYNPKTGDFFWKNTKGRRVKGNQAGYVSSLGYRYIEHEGKSYRACRLAWFFVHGKFPEFEIDHIDQNKLNDSIDNLRDVNPSTNCHNRRQYDVDNKIGNLPRGVYLRKTASGDKYRAIIGVKGKNIYLGTFASCEEAEEVYNKEKLKYV
ncbi:hypothetical protein [Escherichia phage EK010]|uniref:AP2/ERF domain-containing protein n=1 Tax=Escherichia phage EK010 TaxID=2742112 RepID=A0A6J4EIT9_9CAUD|nr:HNH endonuclease [Escherichia phage EK010]UYE89963.1 hypothetical protein [Escherichia phage E20-1]BCG44986.1 hypothetical protein [Escherichia phage EK010]